MTLDNEEQRKMLLQLANATSVRGDSAKKLGELIEAIEGASISMARPKEETK